MSVEFEHYIGLNAIPSGAIFHPDGQSYLYSSGANVVIGNLTDPHSQAFFRFHDDCVSCLTLSKSGRTVASGQQGINSNVFVWDFATREIIYCFEEHDHKVQNVAFSDDEKLLVTLGCPEDNKLIVWDMSSGNIVASSGKMPVGTTCIAHGGFMRDIKRRDTRNYLFCTGGQDGFVLWNLDPYTGEFEVIKIAGDARASVLRVITALSFSPDKETIFGSSSSGDFLMVNVKHQRIVGTVAATRAGIGALLSFEGGVIIGCGDATIKFFDGSNTFIGFTKLDAAVNSLSFSPDKLEV